MLDSETKRHIDNARDILVGKVTDPKSQIDLITIALIYKFMDDMDLEAVDVGGKRSFFVKDLKNLAFSKIMDSKIGAQERMDLYAKVLEKLPFASSIPELFRTIFRDAFLPFRDPQTLTLFLKEIANFSYSNSENLGNAFEYLLSIMGSQGDAGQFRTPRHIIDFIVQVINPKKTESILDPACGTAGFLISAYLHVMKNNKNLSTREIQKFTQGITGYDIDPGMRKLALVNLYLHKFAEPKIFEYDTLTSDEKWNEKFDIIVANPPFMTPKGGIRPHNKFGVQANRSEVLFVDYIAEHLSINGRAGIIVPEGIIFQSSTAYKALRKMLVEENYLWAVVSLPAGVFQPYAGVKTSILFLDRKIAKSKNEILFVKIENDGFDLGAQRRKIEKNDLPNAITELVAFIQGTKPKTNTLIVSKLKLAEDGEYNLTAGRYQEHTGFTNCVYDLVKLGDVAEIISGQSPEGQYYNQNRNGIPFYQGRTEFGDRFLGEPKTWTTKTTKIALKNDILMSVRAPVGPVNVCKFDKICIGRGLAAIRTNEKVLWEYIFYLLKSMEDKIVGTGGAVFDSINRTQIEQIKIPLPPLETQKQIVAEIENKQQAIDNARRTIDLLEREREYFGSSLNGVKYEEVMLEKVCNQITDGTHITPHYTEKGIPFLRVTDITETNGSKKFISETEHKKLIKRCNPQKGNVLLTKNGTIGVAKDIDWDYEFSIFVSLCLLKPKPCISSKYLAIFLNSKDALLQMKGRSKVGTITNLHLVEIKQIKIPLPSLAEQEKIVAQFNEEQEIIEANKKLIEIMKKKIERVMERIT